MPIPIFIIHELLMRIHELDPSVGSYQSHTFNTSGTVIVTTSRKVRIRKAILNRQFKDPGLVSESDLFQIISS